MLLAALSSSQTLWLLLAYCVAVIVASIVGGLLPEWIRLTHTRMQLMISFVGGVMLGIAVFHMIPHAWTALPSGNLDEVMWGVMIGLVVTFFMLRFLHFHQHGPADFGILADEQSREQIDNESLAESTHLCSEHNHPTAGSSSHAGHECHHSPGGSSTRWIGVLVGLSLHTLMDGVAMASGLAADVAHGGDILLPGLGIFLAVLLHKPLDAVSITSLMHPVTTPTKRLIVNAGFALMCPLGAFLFIGGISAASAWSASLAGWALAFSAGVFLCLALSDLLPEMEFHSHNRIPLSLALLAGILAAWAIGLAEGEHAHGGKADGGGHHGHVHSDQPAGNGASASQNGHADHQHDPHAGHSH